MNQTRTATTEKRVVLVFDNDLAVRNSLKFSLEIEGFEVHTYSSADELLNVDELPACGCLIVNYHIPTMNGLELVAKLRNQHVLMPAILITGYLSDNVRKRAAAAGVPVVEKPFFGSRLIDCINRVFDGKCRLLS